MHNRISKEEAAHLRTLALQVKEISLDPKWKEKKELGIKLNKMEKTRPLVIFPPECWHELVPEETLRVKDPVFRSLE